MDTCLPAGRVHLTTEIMYIVYIIQSKIDKRLYKGLTTDLDRRIKKHNSRRTKSTRPYKQWNIVYFEEYSSKEEARKREQFFKTGEGRELLKKIIGPVA